MFRSLKDQCRAVSKSAGQAAPDQHARDTGPLGTTVLDTLKANGLIDGAVRRLTFEWAEDGPGEWAEDDKWAEDRPRCVVLIQQEVAA